MSYLQAKHVQTWSYDMTEKISPWRITDFHCDALCQARMRNIFQFFIMFTHFHDDDDDEIKFEVIKTKQR
jgi:hypothetical protein